jgi:mRNA-degrading endonuclease toxin of MazEF toxin-antitoxin module
MQFGDIYLVEIPLSSGHEQAGLRPAVIVQEIGIEKVLTVFNSSPYVKTESERLSFYFCG